MAMNVEEELANEKKPDTSFLKAKYTKKRSEVKAPYGQIPEIDDKKITIQGLDKKIETTVAKKEHGATQAKYNISKDKLSRKILVPRESEFVKKFGHQYFAYFSLIKTVAKDNIISFSQPELAEILVVEKSSVRKIINEMIGKGMLKKTEDADPKTKRPAQYQLVTDI